MEGERLVTLEQALAELQAKDANTQHKLDILISHIPQSENPIPSTQITSVTPKAHGLKVKTGPSVGVRRRPHQRNGVP